MPDSGQRLKNLQERLTLTRQSYRFGLSNVFLGWGILLFLLVYALDLPARLAPADLLPIAQLSAVLAGFSLILLLMAQTLIRQNRLIKQAFFFPAYQFLLAALLAVFAVSSVGSTALSPLHQSVKTAALIAMLVLLGILSAISMDVELIINRLQDRLGLFAFSFAVGLRVSEWIAGAAPYALPPLIIMLWFNPQQMAASILALIFGGFLYLLVFAILLTVEAFDPSIEEERHIRTAILEILEEIHSAKLHNETASGPYGLVSLDTLMGGLVRRRILKNPRTIHILLEDMAHKDLIYFSPQGVYLFPSLEEIGDIPSAFGSISLVVSGYLKNNPAPLLSGGLESTFLSMYLSEATRYPIELVERYFLPAAIECLEDAVTITYPSQDAAAPDSYFKVFFKTQQLLKLRDFYTQSANLDPIPVEEQGQVFFNALKADKILTIPRKFKEMEQHPECLEAVYRGLEDILGQSTPPAP